jgi:hypothetical protein
VILTFADEPEARARAPHTKRKVIFKEAIKYMLLGIGVIVVIAIIAGIVSGLDDASQPVSAPRPGSSDVA